jgi:probable HAF family extracellular repeat protein
MISTTLIRITGVTLFIVLALPGQPKADPLPHFIVTDLGTLGGTFSIAFSVSRVGDVAGGATLANGSEHPFLWTEYEGMRDLGTLGGPNGNATGPNGRGELAALSETTKPDPLGEDFCGFGTHLMCLAAVWKDGKLRPLPTLGGTNGQATGLNDRGELIGIAETDKIDPTCAPPQRLRYEGALWGPKEDQIEELRPLPGDTVGFAIGINNKGDAVGATGTCANTVLFPLSIAPHAVLWRNGSPINLGNLGGKSVNVAAAINDRGEVVGTASLPGDTVDPAFVWTERTGMINIGMLTGDKSGLPGGFGGINNLGQVVGASCSGYAGAGNCRAFLWQDNVMTDINTLIPASSPLYLMFAFQINDVGEIVGLGLTSTGQAHAFLASPVRTH